MKVFKFFIIFMLISPLWAADKVPATIESRMLDKIIKTDSICKTCRFIVQKKNSDWIKKHVVYEITTFDILPPPAWHMAVRSDKDIFFLDRRKIEDWNNVMTNEKIKLDQDVKIIDYAKFFLATTMNQSEYIEKLLPSEIKRIESKEKKKIEPQTKIVKTQDKIQIVFYANDTQGDLQQWNLVLSESGEILKLQEHSF